MAACAYCRADTQLKVEGVAICRKCSDERENKRTPPNPSPEIRSMLQRELIRATNLNNEALKEFHEAIGKSSSGLPERDGMQRIMNASNKLNVTRNAMMNAHNRLSEYL